MGDYILAIRICKQVLSSPASWIDHINLIKSLHCDVVAQREVDGPSPKEELNHVNSNKTFGPPNVWYGEKSTTLVSMDHL